MSALLCTYAGSICGAALFGNRTRKSSFSAQISSSKSSVSSRRKVSVCQTLRSSTWSLIRAIDTACSRWPVEFTNLCVRAASYQVMQSSAASSTIRKRNRSRLALKTSNVETQVQAQLDEIGQKKSVMIMTMLRIENIYCSARRNSCSTRPRSFAGR